MVLVDQLTKLWAVKSLADGPVEVVWTLDFRLVRNFGGSFGVGEGNGLIISLVGLVVIAALVFAMRIPRPRAAVIAFGFFVGGAAGNIIDRVFRADDGAFSGGVVDFIDFGWWPVFNVADISLFVGVGVLLLFSGTDAQPDADTAEAGDA